MLNKTVILLLAMGSLFLAQTSENEKLSGKLLLDSHIAFNSTYSATGDESGSTPGKKSPLLAGVMSFLVPGAGEAYVGSYWKTALFVAIEAAAITTNIIYNGHGDSQTENFENFANQHWSAARYALWTVTNKVNPGDYPNLFNDAAKTQVNWDVLNQMERDIGDYYSHTLDKFGEQQYYEMIGKYRQFAPGWDDFGDENTPYQFGDPVSSRFTYYSGERAKANDFYSVAKTALIIVVTNHLASAVDAALSASAYNKSIETKVSIESKNIGFYTEHSPRVNFKINF
ncbi:MAG: hypothetical protein SCALA702_03310 [Melioribacteraceae bacterium]|nr:MAG: hypothetical protein SCALA702_03310 [Melioribacteraceae bacterium]